MWSHQMCGCGYICSHANPRQSEVQCRTPFKESIQWIIEETTYKGMNWAWVCISEVERAVSPREIHKNECTKVVIAPEISIVEELSNEFLRREKQLCQSAKAQTWCSRRERTKKSRSTITQWSRTLQFLSTRAHHEPTSSKYGRYPC